VPVAKDAARDSVEWMKTTFQAVDTPALPEVSRLIAETVASPLDPFPAMPDELSDILLTTGTTGGAKGVMLSHRNIKAAIDNVIAGQCLTTEERVLIPIPVNHSFGIRVLRAVLYQGATVVLANGFSSIKLLNDFIHEYNCTGMCCVPTAISLLYQQTRGSINKLLGSLRYIEFAAAPFSTELKERLLGDLPQTRIINSYGSTEAAGVIYMDYRARGDKLSSIGKPSPGVAVRIVDDECHEIKSHKDNIGRLAIRGDVVMGGYWNDTDLTNKTIVNGWLLTNDCAYIDDEGYVFLMGRSDDVINTGGKKVSPLEIEETVLAFPGVRECCCISVNDPQGIVGQVPVVFVTMESGESFAEKQLYDYLAGHLEKYKIPQRIIPIDEIPKNYMGKYLRRDLAEIWKKEVVW
jgi:long-chain acyl-CoA synthetase